MPCIIFNYARPNESPETYIITMHLPEPIEGYEYTEEFLKTSFAKWLPVRPTRFEQTENISYPNVILLDQNIVSTIGMEAHEIINPGSTRLSRR